MTDEGRADPAAARVVKPAPSATVVVVRGSGIGREVVLLRRNPKLGYHGGSWVFPGGRIDPGDRGEDALIRARHAAVREAQEESGLRLDPAGLVHHAHWITPVQRPRRFATDYFLARADGVLRPDGSEIVESQWIRPGDALAARARGEIVLPPPTFVTLWRLHHEGDALFEGPVFHILPRIVSIDDHHVALYPGDVGYDEVALEREGPRHRAHFGPKDWRYERRIPE